MARGEVRYRLTLDSNFKDKAEESANAIGKAENATEEWGKTSQRAAMRMEAMHERALKLNNAFKSGSDETQRNADTLRAFDQATGGAISSTAGLASTLDLANVGFKNLNTTAAGFNAQSAGVVGAGLAIGTAIGSWLNTFPEVQHAVDGLRDSLIEMLGQGLIETSAEKMKTAMAGIGDFSAKMAKDNDEAVARQIAGLKAQGLSIEAIDAIYRKHDPEARTAIDRLHEESEAHKKAAEEAKKHAAKAAEEFQKYLQSVKETTKATEAARAADDKFVAEMQAKGHAALWAMADDNTKAAKKMAEVDRARFDEHIKGVEEMHKAETKFFEDVAEEYEKNLVAQHKAQEQVIKDIDDVGAILNDIDGLMQQLGVTSDSTLGRMMTGFKAVQQGAKAYAQFASGDILGGISSGIGAISGLAGALGIGGNKEHMQVNDMRDEYVKAAGGIEILNQKAHAAGMTLDAMLKAKTVNEYQAAVEKLNGAMDLHGQAVSALQSAQEKYQVGWSKLDQTAGEMLRDQNLLIAAGFSQQEVANGMAGAYSEYVQQVIESGGTIPEAMRSTIDLLQQQGKLVDENGDAYDDATVKGLNFTEKLTDQMSKLVDEIHRMVNALLGINDVDINVGVGTHPTGGGRASGGEEDYKRDRNSFAEGTGGFRDFGSGTPAMLHGTEAVVRPIDLSRMLRGGGGTTVVRLSLGNREFGQAIAQTASSGRMRPKQQLRRGLH